MVRPGMHLNAVGGDCPGKTELDAAILLRLDARIVVEYEPQTRIEGELQQVDATTPVIGFDRIVRGDAAGRASADDVTIFDSVGFALEDFSSLRYLHDLIDARPELGRKLDLIPHLSDPKNLFGGALNARSSVLRRTA